MPITHDSSTGQMSVTTSASTSHSLGYGSGTNRIVVAYALAYARKQADSAFTSFTYNSVEGTFYNGIVSATGDVPHVRVHAYYWLDSSLPSSSGSYTVSLTTSKATDCGFTVTSIIGAKQQTADAGNGTGTDAGGTTAYFSTSLTPNSANAFLIDGACVKVSGNATADGGQTERYDSNPGFTLGLCSTRPATTITSYTMGWTCGENWQDYAQYVTSWAPLEEAANPVFMFAGLT